MGTLTMRRGAVAMLDALGTKEMAGRVDGDHAAVIGRLKDVADRALIAVANRFAPDDQDNKYGFIRVLFLSDTIVIFLAPRTPEDVRARMKFTPQQELLDATAVRAVCDVAHEVVVAAAEDYDLPFTYRGCVAFGDFMTEDNFVVGEAAFEAAKDMETAEGAFVWLAQSAQAAVTA